MGWWEGAPCYADRCAARRLQFNLFAAAAAAAAATAIFIVRALSPPPLQPVLGRPASTSNRGSMIMLKVDASSATGVPSSPRPGTPRLVPKQD